MHSHSPTVEAPERTAPRVAGDSSFFESYAGQFQRDLEHQLQSGAEDALIRFDLDGLYRTLFLSPCDEEYAGRVRESFRELVMSSLHAEAALKRTWMKMAANHLDHQLKNGGSHKQQSALKSRLAGFSKLLDDVYFDMGRDVRASEPDIDRSSAEHRSAVAAFAALAAGGAPSGADAMRLFTCYQGVPVECVAEIREVTEDSVRVYVNRCQAAVLAKVPLAVIETPVHRKSLRAFAVDVDISSQVVTLSYFTPHQEGIERRAHVRVEFEEPIEARICYGKYEVTGRLLDLSTVAVALHFRNVPLYELNEGAEVRLQVVMPRLNDKGALEINIPGRVIKILQNVRGDQAATRVVVHMYSDSALDGELARYIARRQTEILREISKRPAPKIPVSVCS